MQILQVRKDSSSHDVLHVSSARSWIPPPSPEAMNLWYIIILLTIQGLALRCCEGQSNDLFGDKGPWEEDEWDEGSAASEKDDDSGFESGGTIHEEEHDKEHAQQLPKFARTFTTSRFVTSGEGENKGGSTEDDGRYSNSNRNKDHESSSGGFTSGINFAKIGDALDVMRKLKKGMGMTADITNKLMKQTL
ncbi:PREDICTED: uncharacterized protein LOC107357866 [Acropora digitifera]|uniref:uncharacterized protein LOC107357866 n=1 Tax=Acropora digitifera TaxID=70779 RepID=UPI00077AA3D3|nr:PREDICTED: uncharacterized protein LOC107357866 [Acropora digitifera]